MVAANTIDKENQRKEDTREDMVWKSQAFLERLLIEAGRCDPSDSLQTPEGLSNAKSMATTSELCVTAANLSQQCYSGL